MSAERNDMTPAVTKPDDTVPSTDHDIDPAATATEAEMMSAMGFAAFGAAPRGHGPKRGRENARPVPTPPRAHVNAQGDDFAYGVYMGQGVVAGHPPGWGGEAKKKRKVKHKGFQPEKAGAGTGANSSALGKNDKMAGLGSGSGAGPGLDAGNGASAGTAFDGTALSRIKPGSEELEVVRATAGYSEGPGDAKVKRVVTFAEVPTTTSREITSAAATFAEPSSATTTTPTATSEENSLKQKLEGTGMSTDSTEDNKRMGKNTGTTYWSKLDVRSEMMLPPPKRTRPTTSLPSNADAMDTAMDGNARPYHEGAMEITYGDEEYAKLVAQEKESFKSFGMAPPSQAAKPFNPAAPSFTHPTSYFPERMANMSSAPALPRLVPPTPSSANAIDTRTSSPLSPPHDLRGFYAPSSAGSTGSYATNTSRNTYNTYGTYDTPSTRSLGYTGTTPSTTSAPLVSLFTPATTTALPAKPPGKKIKVGVLEFTEEELEAYNNGVVGEDGAVCYFHPSSIEDPWAESRKNPVYYPSI